MLTPRNLLILALSQVVALEVAGSNPVTQQAGQEARGHQGDTNAAPCDASGPAYPVTLDQVQPLRVDGRPVAWATPIAKDRWLVARHSVTGGRLEVGGHEARVVWRDDRGGRDGLARIEAPTSATVPIARGLPEPGSRVWIRGYLPGAVPTRIPGWWLGVDADGVGHVYTLAWPGTSSSGVLTDDGQLVAVVSRGANGMVAYETPVGDSREQLRQLDARSHVSPTVLTQPVAGRELPR